MSDSGKTKKELLNEIASLRARLESHSLTTDNSAQIELQRSAKRYKQIFETNQAVKLIIDPTSGTIVKANKSACLFYGYSANEILKKKISDINILPENEVKKEMALAKSEKRLFFNFRHRLASGEIRDVEVYSGPIIENERTLLYSIIHDVTEKKQLIKVQNILLNISKATGESDSLEDLLGVIHEQVGSLIDATNFYVAIYNKHTKEYSFPYYVDEFDKGDDFTQEEMPKSLTEYVRVKNTPMLIDELLCRELIAKGVLNLVGHSSLQWMGVPFPIDKHMSGIVVCQSYLPKTSYTKNDLELMTFVSEHIAWAIGRKKSEQQIRESEDRYRSVVDGSPLSIAIHSNGRLIFVNNAAIHTFGGKNEKDFIGKPISMFVHPDYKDVVKKRVNKLQRNRNVPTMEEKFIRLDGRTIDVEVMASPISYQGKNAVQVVVTDITERKKAEQSVKASEESYKGLFDNATDAIYILDKNGVFIDVNTSTLKLYAYPYDYFIGKTLDSLATPGENDLKKINSQISLAYNGKSQIFEFYGLSKKGEILITEVHLNASVYFGQKVVIANAHDITRRKKEQQKLEQSEERFRALIEKSPVAISLSRGGKILFVNQAYLEVFRINPRKEIIGTSLFDNVAASEKDNVANRNRNREKGKPETSSYETIGLRDDGTTFPFHVTATIFELSSGPSTLSFITDISGIKQAQDERLNLERQILQTQKLESLGVLAGGIAHDFNNLLTGIMGNTGLALLHSENQPLIKKNLVKIEHIASRAAELCNQMLAYSGKGQFVIQTLDLNEVIRDMVLLLNVSIPKKVELDVQLDDSIATIEGDITQLRQIIMNLITNAADSMEGRPGKITLSSRQEMFTGDYLATPYIDSEFDSGIYVVFEVNDNGCGMSEETLQKLFDPFFTTKFTGRGLGLAAVLGIVRGHNGSLKIESKPGKGTNIKVILPVSSKKVQYEPKKKSRYDEFKGSGTILVVDDEEAVRLIVKEVLEYCGFNILLAKNGLEAVKIFKDNFHLIELVLLDMTMPKLNGVETYKKLIKINPDIRVILSSGFNEQESINRLSNGKKISYLQKPYHLQTLKDKIFHELEELVISAGQD